MPLRADCDRADPPAAPGRAGAHPRGAALCRARSDSHHKGGQDGVPEPLSALGAAADYQAPPQLGTELMGKGLLRRSWLQPSVDTS